VAGCPVNKISLPPAHLGELPRHILQDVFVHLQPTAVIGLRQVCHGFCEGIDRPELWARIAARGIRPGAPAQLADHLQRRDNRDANHQGHENWARMAGACLISLVPLIYQASQMLIGRVGWQLDDARRHNFAQALLAGNQALCSPMPISLCLEILNSCVGTPHEPYCFSIFQEFESFEPGVSTSMSSEVSRSLLFQMLPPLLPASVKEWLGLSTYRVAVYAGTCIRRTMQVLQTSQALRGREQSDVFATDCTMLQRQAVQQERAKAPMAAALARALDAGDLLCIDYIIEHLRVPLLSHEGVSPLSRALRKGSSVTEYLLDKGVHPSTQHLHNALQLRLGHEDPQKVPAALLVRLFAAAAPGATQRLTQAFGAHFLAIAVEANDVDVAEVLLVAAGENAKALMDALSQNSGRNTLFYLAARQLTASMFALFCKMGGDPHRACGTLPTVAAVAQANGHAVPPA
jgi:hypothetical protein